jgi:hypothetical protein
MIKKIEIKFEAVEMMLYYWQSIAEREKVSESYLTEVADNKDMNYCYNMEFSPESVRKVLSAISNRELLNNATQAEKKFWNCNMWMVEDLDNMNNMVKPVKMLNLDYLVEKLNEHNPKYENIEVHFIPGHEEEYKIEDNKLIINFFKIMINPMDETDIKITGKPFKEYIEEKLIELIS